MNVVRSLIVFALLGLVGGCFIDLDDPPPTVPNRPIGPPPTIFAEGPPPPAITGGTLLVTRDGTAVAADPDRDRVWLADIDSRRLLHEIVLEPGDEPGRVAEDGDGRVHVALRRGGAVVDVDLATGSVIGRRAVCAAPRGIAWDPENDSLYVACVGGDVVALPAAGGEVTRRVTLDDDLRDVVIDGPRLLVSRFRSAEVLILDRATFAMMERVRPPGVAADSTDPRTFEPIPGGLRFAPSVAWRMLPAPGGGALLLHQRAQSSTVETEPDPVTGDPGYGGGGGSVGSFRPCNTAIVHGAMTRIRAGEAIAPAATLEQTVLPVDFTLTNDASALATVTVAAAGNRPLEVELDSSGFPLGSDPTAARTSTQLVPMNLEGITSGGLTNCGSGSVRFDRAMADFRGEAVAVASWHDRVVTQLREPAGLVFEDGTRIDFAGAVSRRNTGHAHFHRAAGAPLACASCHAEGGDDGHTWTFAGMGPRRTQTFRGGFRGTEPLHWDGSLSGFEALVDEVMVRRMGAPGMWRSHIEAIGDWVDTIPDLPRDPVADPEAVARGEAIFHDPDVACATCHAGETLTNNETVSVGTGPELQVPSLRGLVFRGPFLHDGCARTLEDRFRPECGGGDDHGLTSSLSESEISDLVAYLKTL